MELEGRLDVEDVLSSEIRVRFPGVPVGRPSRFYDTVKRIVGPTKPSVRGPPKLVGSPLASYRKRVWEPRIRTTGIVKNVKCSWQLLQL